MSTETTAVGAEWVTFLTWDQLSAAIVDSCDRYEDKFATFVAVAQSAADAALASSPMLAELRAEMDGAWAACKAQSVMTHALTDERAARRDRGDYA